MSVNLTKVKARINNIKKKIYYDKDITSLKLYNINELLAELEKDWYMPTLPTSNLALGAEYFELYIADTVDDIDLTTIVPLTTAVEFNGERYRVMPYSRPRGATQQWYMRVESTGEKSD